MKSNHFQLLVVVFCLIGFGSVPRVVFFSQIVGADEVKGLGKKNVQEGLDAVFLKFLLENKYKTGDVVFLSPRFPKSLTPKLSEFAFRQLEYSEVGGGQPYLELYEAKGDANRVKGEFAFGNDCVKTNYTFVAKKMNGAFSISYRSTGESVTHSPCPGCPLDSRKKYAPFATSRFQAKLSSMKSNSRLSLFGKVEKLEFWRNEDGKSSVCRVTLDLEIRNQGAERVILLKPNAGFTYWHGGTSLFYLSGGDDVEKIYQRSHWPGIYTSEPYLLLARDLDQPAPPEKLTEILQPGKSLRFTTTTEIDLSPENQCDVNISGIEAGWNTLVQMKQPIFLTVSFEMWPFNVENFKKDLGGILAKRWKSFGKLFLQEKSNGHWFAYLTSQPIEIDFREARPIAPPKEDPKKETGSTLYSNDRARVR